MSSMLSPTARGRLLESYLIQRKQLLSLDHGELNSDLMIGTNPLVMTNIANWKTTMFIGKIHYFHGNFA